MKENIKSPDKQKPRNINKLFYDSTTGTTIKFAEKDKEVVTKII